MAKYFVIDIKPLRDYLEATLEWGRTEKPQCTYLILSLAELGSQYLYNTYLLRTSAFEEMFVVKCNHIYNSK